MTDKTEEREKLEAQIERILRTWYDDEDSGTYIEEVRFLKDDEKGEIVQVLAVRKGSSNNFTLPFIDTAAQARYCIKHEIDDPDEIDEIMRGFKPIPMQPGDPGFPKIICLCGSTQKALEDFREQNKRLTFAGHIVLSIGVDTKSDDSLFAGMDFNQREKMKHDLDMLHLRKIDLADEVMILNRDGYVGQSTMRELKYAILLGKTITWLEPEKAIVPVMG